MAKQENGKTEQETVSTKVVENKQMIFTQMNHTRVRTKDDDFDPANPRVTKTVKTYQRRVVRKIGPDGEVIEESVEEGEPILESSFPATTTKPAGGEEVRSAICGQSRVEATFGCRTVAENGEESVSQYSTGPLQVPISSDNVQHSFPIGASVTKHFRQDKTQSVTHSSVRDGQERVLYSKSEFQSISGESNLKVKPMLDKNENDENTSEDKIEPKTNETQHKSPQNDIPGNDNKKIDESEPITSTDGNTLKTDQLDPTSRLSELSKLLDFSTFNKNINILDKQVLKEGEVRAFDDLQVLPKAWKKIIKKRQIVFQLIVFNDLVVLARKHSQTKFVVLEYCERKRTSAFVYQLSENPIIEEKAKPKSSGSKLFSCVSAKEPPTKHDSNRLFVLGLISENGGSLTEPLILSVSTTEARNKWIEAITHA